MPMVNQPNQVKSPAQPIVKPVMGSSMPKPPGSKPSVMQSFAPPKQGISGIMVFFVLIIMIALGVGVGYSASLFSVQAGGSFVPKALNPNAPVKGKLYGNGDPSIFKDTAEGTVQKGGIDGEGAFHLVRPGGDSQNVYLTSSTVDLSQFIGSKVKVWGETQKAQHAGWLMDVGKVQAE
ncbi:MAG TPA: hypothetical protein VND99_06065 [Candidatus Acidoferrales bacterium]|nr:hypothetical protein [Candidatus Acidoferrales bacterium]